MIAVVDYCKGNLKSVERGLRAVGGDARITDDPACIKQAEGIVLPGVGAFADASATMVKTGQLAAIQEAIAHGTPFLGICLGLHLLFSDGVEGAGGPGVDGAFDEEGNPTLALPQGLDVIPGTVVHMPSHDSAGVLYKVPHVGWNSIEFDAHTGESCPLLDGIAPGEYFYFTHSYVAPNNAYTQATTTHSVSFPCIVQRGSTVFGVQFHPEKSSDAGAHILRNFLRIVEAHKGACAR